MQTSTATPTLRVTSSSTSTSTSTVAGHPRKSRATPVGNTDPFTPTQAQPVRVRARPMPADTHFEPHRHAWAQLAYCATGLVQVTCATATAGPADDITYVVPPSRAVWIAPGACHAIRVLERAELRTLYLDASVTPVGWQGSRVIVVSSLLRELVEALEALATPAAAALAGGIATPPPGTAIGAAAREAMLTSLVLDEITHAAIQALGVPLPPALTGDKRLRALCEAVMRAPAQRATLSEWAADVGASERTMARLFREELGTSYQQWRQQAVLAHALPMLARGVPVSQVAAASGYASDSAFSAMFKAAMGQSPSYFSARVE